MDLSFLDTINLGEKRTKTLLFVVDTAGDMRDEYLKTTNRAIKNVISDIRTIQKKRAEIRFDIAVLEFYGDKIANLRPHSPQNVAEYSWNDLKNENNGYGANISIAFQELIEKNVFENHLAGYLSPAIILIANSVISDDYKKELNVLKDKPQFKSAFKAAIALGDGASKEKLKEITDNEKYVAVVRKPKELCKYIHDMTITGALYDLVDEKVIQKLLYNNNDANIVK